MITASFAPLTLQQHDRAPATTYHRAASRSTRRARRTRELIAPLLARAVAILVTIALVAGLGALLFAEYALLWHTLVVPWLGTGVPIGGR